MGCRKYLTNDNFLPKITNLSIFNNKMSSQNIDPCGRLGTLKWRGRYYVCSTVDRAEQFGEEPDLYTSAVRALVARHTVLEQLLVTSHSGGQTQDGPLDSGDMKVVLTIVNLSLSHCSQTDASSQTETHPLSSVINPDYKWNEWDMRREALNVANMRSARVK